MKGQLLQVEDIEVKYSRLLVIHDVSIDIHRGEIVCMVGSNGSGKTTIMKTIMGALRVADGQILFNGSAIHNLLTQEIVSLGITYVPEGRMLFDPLSVEENLFLGAYLLKDKNRINKNLQFIYELFPILKERRIQSASTLSGGEQQMLAIGRGLMSNPQLLMLDEPSLGLAPQLVDEVFGIIRRLKEEKMTLFIVEQNVREALEISDRGYVLQTGKISLKGSGEEMLKTDLVRRAFLGI